MDFANVSDCNSWMNFLESPSDVNNNFNNNSSDIDIDYVDMEMDMDIVGIADDNAHVNNFLQQTCSSSPHSPETTPSLASSPVDHHIDYLVDSPPQHTPPRHHKPSKSTMGLFECTVCGHRFDVKALRAHVKTHIRTWTYQNNKIEKPVKPNRICFCSNHNFLKFIAEISFFVI